MISDMHGSRRLIRPRKGKSDRPRCRGAAFGGKMDSISPRAPEAATMQTGVKFRRRSERWMKCRGREAAGGDDAGDRWRM